jgi:hypothetical protein
LQHSVLFSAQQLKNINSVNFYEEEESSMERKTKNKSKYLYKNHLHFVKMKNVQVLIIHLSLSPHGKCVCSFVCLFPMQMPTGLWNPLIIGSMAQTEKPGNVSGAQREVRKLIPPQQYQ